MNSYHFINQMRRATYGNKRGRLATGFVFFFLLPLLNKSGAYQTALPCHTV